MRKVEAVRAMGIVVVLGCAIAVCTAHPIETRYSDLYSSQQSLTEKLQQKTQFRPKPGAPLDQLIEVAKTFQIPMGIEWNDSATCQALPADFGTQDTVAELLHSIVDRCRGQRLMVEHGMVHVYSSFARHPHNILNLRLWRFRVRNSSVFDALFELRLAIDMQLHPAKYAGGWNGGHGSPADDVFSIPNISFSAKNVRIRDVLDGIVKSSGNALWIVRLRSATVNQRVPLSRMYKDDDEIVRIWELIPLRETR